MKTHKKMEKAKIIFIKYGQKAFEMAKNAILQEKNIYERVYEALRYFMEESWYDVQHPALISLACEAVGGNPNDTTQIGAAMVLLAGAADIHDDIIDKSKTKGSKQTVFGKFGKDVTLLAGDALLFKGLTLLHEACKRLPKSQSQVILNLAKQAFFEIGSAEAKETSLKGKYDVTLEEYRRVIEMKAAVAEACARIGAILGSGNPKEIDALSRYGRVIGILMTIRDDFIDLFESNEIRNRAKNECLPLPVLLALRNATTKNEIVCILEKDKITEQETQRIVDLVMDHEEVQELKREMLSLIKETIGLLVSVKQNKYELELLLRSTIEDL
jgi:geranylgeranyl diphosphate synthase type I